MVSLLCVAKVDLKWADNQYWSVLYKVVGELARFYAPKQKKKITSSEASKYIR